MPRNRKRRPPAEPIDVRIDEAGSLSCGRCGQAFPSIIFNERIAAHVMSWDDEGFETRQITPEIETRVSDGQSAPWLATMSITAWGWRFDGEAWRPTSESHSRLHRQEPRAEAGDPVNHSRARNCTAVYSPHKDRVHPMQHAEYGHKRLTRHRDAV
jgi:hypothetical protein